MNQCAYLIDSQNLSITFLNLLQLPQEIPTIINIVKDIINPIKVIKLKTLEFVSELETYQNLDLARTSLVAQSFMR